MAKLSRAQRRAKNMAKQEKLKRDRAEQQKDPIQDAPPPTVITEAAKIPEAPIDNSATEQQRSDKARNRPSSTRAETAIAFFTVGLIIVALVQGVAMVVQNNIMREQMGQTEDTLELMRQERGALIQVMTPRVEDFEKGKRATFHTILHNAGKTTAKITELRHAAFFENAKANLRQDLESWDTDDYHHGGLVLAPDGNIQVDRVQNHATPDHEIDHVNGSVEIRPNMGVRTLFFVVEVFYTDELNTEGHTRALYSYRPDMKRFATDSTYGVMDRQRRKHKD